MTDPRVNQHARILMDWSTQVKPGEMVLIRSPPEAYDLALSLTREAARRGGSSMITMEDEEFTEAHLKSADEQTVMLTPRHLLAAVEKSDVIIWLDAPHNSRTLSSISAEKLISARKAREQILKALLSKRWCETIHPCRALAQEAGMSLEEYQDFAYGAIVVDWAALSAKMQLVADCMNSHDEIRLIGPETDLYARTEGRKWMVANGKENMPCGEVYTSPVEDSVEGSVFFDVPFLYQGRVLEGVRLRFEHGIVVDYSAEKEERTLKVILEVDEGATRLGEIAMGMNRGIKRPTMNMLFDEKMGDTIHCALGLALKECGGVNQSAIHVDMIKTMLQGEILAGNEIVYSKGRYFHELENLPRKPRRRSQ